MDGIIGVIFYFIVICLVIKSKKKKSAKANVGNKPSVSTSNKSSVSNNDKRYATVNSHYSTETLKGKTQQSFNNSKPQEYKPQEYKPQVDIITTVNTKKSFIDTQGASHTLKDDKKNDWLAQQLAYEKKVYNMTSDMFDLKKEHYNSCDADRLRQEHFRNCDANYIDTAR